MGRHGRAEKFKDDITAGGVRAVAGGRPVVGVTVWVHVNAIGPYVRRPSSTTDGYEARFLRQQKASPNAKKSLRTKSDAEYSTIFFSIAAIVLLKSG